MELSGSFRRIQRFLVHPESPYLKDFPDDMDRYAMESFDEGSACVVTDWVQQAE